ncbi:methyltransferase domain-containing protein [Rickettsiales bacterium]|nr:methyltransferase domain-containing protein [Rickettsiales bacterium]
MSEKKVFDDDLLSFIQNKNKNKNALDLACGSGIHSIFLAKNGWKVSSVDIIEQSFKVSKNIKYFKIDLENDQIDFTKKPPFDTFYDLIIVFKYLNITLLEKLPYFLNNNGVLICETFMEGNEKFGRPNNPDFLLKKNQLKKLSLDGLKIILFNQGEKNHSGKKSVMQKAVFKKY